MAERLANAGLDAVDNAAVCGNEQPVAWHAFDDLTQTLLNAWQEVLVAFVTGRVLSGL